MYISTLPLTSALGGVGGKRQAQATLPPGKTRYALYKRVGGAQSRLEGCGKSRPSGTRSLDPLANSKSLYRLRYLDPQI
jgi:hypothetical protein